MTSWPGRFFPGCLLQSSFKVFQSRILKPHHAERRLRFPLLPGHICRLIVCRKTRFNPPPHSSSFATPPNRLPGCGRRLGPTRPKRPCEHSTAPHFALCKTNRWEHPRQDLRDQKPREVFSLSLCPRVPSNASRPAVFPGKGGDGSDTTAR